MLRRWREGGQTVGCWLTIGHAYTAEVMAGLGFDWVCLDMQHGLIGYDDLKNMLPAVSTTPTIPFVRVSWNAPELIMRALDAGAYGVIVPMVNNRREAEQAVAACRYPPDGERSFGPIRAAIYGGAGYAAGANAEIACVVMVETAEGLTRLDEIAATPGIDGVLIGPSDLALALGLTPPGAGEPAHAEAVRRIRDACRAHGVAAGIYTTSLEATRAYLEDGFQFVNLGSDGRFMSRAAAADLKALGRGGARESGY